MNQTFRTKYDQMRQNKPTEPETSSASAMNGDDYSEAGHVRNLCFVWPDGKMQFLNYSYLVTGEFLPVEKQIILEFTTHMVFLKGIHLENLFAGIMAQISRKIVCVSDRYNSIGEKEKAVVNEIKCVKNT